MRKKTVALLLAGIATSGVYAQNNEPFTAYEQKVPGSELSIKMVPIKGGEFLLGSAAGEKGRSADEGPQKKVKIDLTLGMGKSGGFPANSMSQYGALMYCRWLYGKTGVFYRLPTEAEWEYACRAGSATAFPFGDDAAKLGEYAWTQENSEEVYHKVGEKKPNAWGLYDMMGNVGEWTLDQYDEKGYAKAAAANPWNQPTVNTPRTIKGGTYLEPATAARCAARLKSDENWNNRDPQIPRSKWWNADAPFIGFRIVRPVKQPTKAEAEKFFADVIDKFVGAR